MYKNSKKIEDDAGDDTFLIGGTAFYNIYRSNKAIGYILGVEVALGNVLKEVTGGSTIKAIGIHVGTVWESR